jgi:hypothetical protein
MGGPGVVEACSPDANGAIPSLTCGNGGHTHLETDRPVVFPGTEVSYFGDTNNDPLVVEGNSLDNLSLGGFRWSVPQAGGIYSFSTSMTASGNNFFVVFNGTVLFLIKTLNDDGTQPARRRFVCGQ